MKNKKIISVLSIAALTTMLAGAVDASALSWKDGAPANYYFTYSADNGHITSVKASDTNKTFEGDIKKGDTIVTKTGTIVWRDSYTNVTTFIVDVDPGYVLDSIAGNVGDATIETLDEENGIYSFHFTDKGAEAWCYGDNVNFTLNTKAINYTVKDQNGNVVSTDGIIGSELKDGYKEGHTFIGWYFNGNEVTTITEDMIKSANENNEIIVSGRYDVNNYNVNVELYYNNDNEICDDDGNRFEQGRLDSTLNLTVPYGTVIDEKYLQKEGIDAAYKLIGGKSVVVKGDTTVKVVKVDRESDADYKIIYDGATDGIKSVTYQVDGDTPRTLDVNEAIEIIPDGIHERHVVFTVDVEDGKELKINCDGSDNTVTRNEDGTYSFEFTMKITGGSWFENRLRTFTLEVVDAE